MIKDHFVDLWLNFPGVYRMGRIRTGNMLLLTKGSMPMMAKVIADDLSGKQPFHQI